MENLDNEEKNAGIVSEESTERVSQSSVAENENPSSNQKGSQSGKKYEIKFDFYCIEALNFHSTPQRDKELENFCAILNSPCINVPLLVAERQEDILPLLSMYEQKKKEISFFSVTPSAFGMDDDGDSPYDAERKMNFAGTVIEEGAIEDAIPVYCGLGDYRNRDMLGQFVSNFVKTKKPAILCVNPQELEYVRQVVQRDQQLSGGIENPEAPYEPYGLARSEELMISPLTNEEKHIYFEHHIKQFVAKNELTCPPIVCRYLVGQILNRFEHQEVFFKVFAAVNRAIVVARKEQTPIISKTIINRVLKEYMPLHNRTRALKDLNTRLKQKIYGQDEAIDTCYEIILGNLIDDATRTKPVVLGFFGPSGVGKTALAEEISLALTGKKASIINMAEYADAFKASILTGSSKGYVDSDEDGLLAKIVCENSTPVIILDEFEKGDPQVQQTFLGVFDKGSVYDNHSGQINMSNALFILTSNAGVKVDAGLGFGSSDIRKYAADRNLIQEAFPPELLGRLDAKILFKPLTRDSLEKIVDKFMLQLKPRFDKLGVNVVLSPEAKQELIEIAQDPSAGARPLLPWIMRIKARIEIGIIKGQLKKGSHIFVQDVEDKQGITMVPKKRMPKINLSSQNTND